MPVPTSSQPVPTTRSASAKQNPNLTAPQSVRMGGSPMSYGAMTGGAGFSFDRPKSVKFGFNPGSYGSRFYGDAGGDSSANFSTSITMGSPSYGNSFIASASAFNLPPSSLSSSYQRRSYADAAARRQTNPNMLSSSIASLSMSYSNPQMGMSFGSYSYSKHQVHRLIDNPDAELARSYECCGLKHAGLHALLEHVEDAHPTLDDDMPMNHGFTPMTHAMDLDLEEIDEEPTLERAASGTGSTRSSLSPHPIPSYPLPPSAGSSKATTPNEHPVNTPMSISDMLTSPPGVDSKINAAARSASTCSSPPDGSLATPTTSSQPSPVFAPPKIGGPRTGFLGTVPRVGHQQRLDRAFNEVVAGKKDQPAENQLPGVTAVAPGVLFASAVAGLGIPTTPPTGQKPQGQDITNDTPNVEGTPSNTATAEPPLPQPSLFSTHKPWRCPNPGCNKAYKQSNGLKYHQQKGQCDFAIHDAVDLGLTVEEAEERNRPFVCAVGAGCNKRYRQMNGLKYHYLNSGAHGEYGLRMLNNGTHPTHPTPTTTPQPTPKRPTTLSTPHTTSSTTNTPTRPSGGAAPYTIPLRDGATPRPAQPRMGTWGGVKTTQQPHSVRPFAAAQPSPAAPRPPQPLPIQRGRDAVLFAAPDVMDVAGRMDA